MPLVSFVAGLCVRVIFFKQKTAYEMRISDWSSDVCSTDRWYREKHDEHFCHVSTEQAGKIAFTENAAKGQIDRQLVMSPGRYLHRFFSAHLDNKIGRASCRERGCQYV